MLTCLYSSIYPPFHLAGLAGILKGVLSSHNTRLIPPYNLKPRSISILSSNCFVFLNTCSCALILTWNITSYAVNSPIHGIKILYPHLLLIGTRKKIRFRLEWFHSRQKMMGVCKYQLIFFTTVNIKLVQNGLN
mgnify:CR=1 FL=1